MTVALSVPDIFRSTMVLVWWSIEEHERREICAAAFCHAATAADMPADPQSHWNDFTQRQRDIIFLLMTRWHFILPAFFESWPDVQSGDCAPDIVASKISEARAYLRGKS